MRIGEGDAIRRELLRTYASAEPVARIDSPHAYPFERGLTLWLCRDRKVPFARIVQHLMPFFVSRQTFIALTDPAKITTVVVWTTNEIYDAWRASPQRAAAGASRRRRLQVS